MRGMVLLGVLLLASCATTSEPELIQGRYALANGMHHFSPCGSPLHYWIVPGNHGKELARLYAELDVKPRHEVFLEVRGVSTPIPPRQGALNSGERAHQFHGRVDVKTVEIMRLLQDGECL